MDSKEYVPKQIEWNMKFNLFYFCILFPDDAEGLCDLVSHNFPFYSCILLFMFQLFQVLCSNYFRWIHATSFLFRLILKKIRGKDWGYGGGDKGKGNLVLEFVFCLWKKKGIQVRLSFWVVFYFTTDFTENCLGQICFILWMKEGRRVCFVCLNSKRNHCRRHER